MSGFLFLIIGIILFFLIVWYYGRIYHFESTLTTWQPIANNAVTPVQLTVTGGNVGEINSKATQFEIPSSGPYFLSMGATWAAGNSAGTRYLILLNNGKPVKSVEGQQTQSDSTFSQTFSFVGNFQEGDVLSLNVYQNSGSSISLVPNNFQSTEWTWFEFRETI